MSSGMNKKILKTPKGRSESGNRRTYDRQAKGKKDKRTKDDLGTIHIQLMIE